MTKDYFPERLDVKAFAHAGGHLSGHDSLLKYQRLAASAQGLHPDLRVDWHIDGEVRAPHGETVGQVWLWLRAEATFPMICQRCLHGVDVPLSVAREFRFVADEATAEVLDDHCEEDVLVLSQAFDVYGLIEDELLMALPLAPRHGVCPIDVPMAAGEEEVEQVTATSPNPFAVLAGLRGDKKGAQGKL